MAGTNTDTSLSVNSARKLERVDTGAVDELLLEGMVIDDRYRIEGLLGEGGMGAVYSAEHVKVGRRVAFKVLGVQWTSVGNVAQRFRDEARAASAAGHPNIIEVFDAGELPDGRPYLVMELLEGRELTAVIAAQGGLELARACRIMRDVARALDAAHARGIIHRDLKGENVMLVGRGGEEIVKVLDFGIAANSAALGPRATTPGLIMGTPAYMAPEQAKGAAPTTAFDIYALGVLLHDALTGRVPFEEVEGLALLAAKTSEPAPSIATLHDDLPFQLVELVDSCLALDPTLRPANAREVADRLTEILELPELDPRSRPSSTEVMPPRKSGLPPRLSGDPSSTSEDAGLPSMTPASQSAIGLPVPGSITQRSSRSPEPSTEGSPWRGMVVLLLLAVLVLGVGWWTLTRDPQPVASVSPPEPSLIREVPEPSPSPPQQAEEPPPPQAEEPTPIEPTPIEPTPIEPTPIEPVRTSGGSTKRTKPIKEVSVAALPSVSPDDPPSSSDPAFCSRTRKQALQAREAYEWETVLRHTRSASCWAEQGDERQWLRAKAFSELGQWDECIKTSRGLDSNDGRKLQDRCRLRKEQQG